MKSDYGQAVLPSKETAAERPRPQPLAVFAILTASRLPDPLQLVALGGSGGQGALEP